MAKSFAINLDEDSFESNAGQFTHFLDRMIRTVHSIALQKGFWDEDRNNAELIALMHSELSEALEALRHGNPPSEHIPDFSALTEELADVVIRVFDMAEARSLDLSGAIVAKAKYNLSRPYKHGKRF